MQQVSNTSSGSKEISASSVALLALGHCAAFADRNLPAVAAPLLKADLGLSDAQLGLLDGPAFAVLYIVGMLISWPLAGAAHRHRLLTACIATWALGMVLFAMAHSFGLLIFARALVGLGQAAFVPLALGLIVECAAPAWRARAMAVFTAAAVAGRSLALLAGGLALAALARWLPASAFAHWRLLFLVMAAPNLLLIILLLRSPEQSPAALAPAPQLLRELLALFRRQPRLLCAYLCGAGASVLIVQTIGAFAPLLLHREQGLTPAAAALAFGVALLIASPLGHLLAGTLVDKRNPKLAPMTIVAGALLLAVPLLWEIPHSGSPMIACTLLALISLVGGTAAVAALAGLPLLLPPALRDIGLRLFLTFITVVGVALGPFMAGVVSDDLGLGGHGLSLALYRVCLFAAGFGMATAWLARAGWQRAATELTA